MKWFFILILRVYIRESLSVDTKSIPIENKNQMEVYQNMRKEGYGEHVFGRQGYGCWQGEDACLYPSGWGIVDLM